MKGSFHQSRRQSNFYNNLKGDRQNEYAKNWVSTLHSKLLIPFVTITGSTKFNREVFYEINIDRLLEVEEENKRLREALEFYANGKNWTEPTTVYVVDHIEEDVPMIFDDNGEKARQALEQ